MRVLGELEATVDGVPADLGGPRQRCVLARLAAEQGRAVSADRLIEDLYADEAPPRALAAVQSYVSHLRRALEPDRAARTPARVLITAPPGYALRLSRDSVDAWWFEDQVRQAEGLDDPAVVHAGLSAALAAWRGGAFQEYADMPWADLAASRLEELRLAAIERLAEAALSLGRAAQVVADLTSLTTEHPLREEAWRLLALALYQSGRQGDALAALRRARARLAEDLGVDPGQALRTLEDDILSHAPRIEPARSLMPKPGPNAVRRKPGAPASTPAEPYVGRDAELEQLMRAAAEAAAGRARIVLVTGDAGAGKTALADQVMRRLGDAGWTTTAGRCPEDETAPPGWPWAEALRSLAAAGGSAASAGPLAPLLTDRPPAGDDRPAARFRLHKAIAAYLKEVSAAAPLLIWLDDLHRADGETLAILTSVTADLPAAGILILGTYRPGETEEPLSGCLASLAAREPVRIALSELDAVAAGELIRAICTRPVGDGVVRAITDRTSGNPFFIGETARLLDSEGELAAATAVPAGVADVLRRRIARLPGTAKAVLAQAAVIGSETAVDVLADVCDVAEDAFLDAVDAGLLTGLVTEPAAGRIRFAHALVRDTLYNDLSRLRRSRLHARAAKAIERHHPSEVAALAHHFTQAGSDPGAAARYGRLAAEQAESRFAYRAAARLWEQAIACLDQDVNADARDRLELVLGLVRTLAHTGQFMHARSWRQGAIRAALPLGDPALLASVITAFDMPMLWSAREYGVFDDELVDTVEQTLARLPDDEPLRCRLLVTLAFELEGAESGRGYQASAQAVRLARRSHDPALLVMAFAGRWHQSFRDDGLDERLRMGTELLALPDRPVTAEALGHLMAMTAHCGKGSFDEADRHADQAVRIADRYDLPVVASRVSFYRALRAALADDPSAADRYQRAGEQMNKLGMWQHGAGLSVLGRFCMLAMQNRAAEAVAELERVYRYPPWTATVTDLYALGLASSGRTDKARAVAGPRRPAGRDPFWLFMTGVSGLLGVAIDDRDRAESAYQALLPFADRPAGADTAVMTLWPVAQILGDIAGYLRLPGADGHYRQALAVARRAAVTSWVQAASQRLHAASQGDQNR